MTCPNCGGIRLTTHVTFNGARPVSGFLCADCGTKFITESTAPNLLGRPEPTPAVAESAEEPEEPARSQRSRRATSDAPEATA